MRKAMGGGLLVGMLMQAHPALAATATRASFGTLADGRAVEAVTLDNGKGFQARVISYGATLQSLDVPDRQGKSENVVLGYADIATYVAHPNFFGATAGRYANRIKGGRFLLDGKAHQLTLTGKTSTLHGGLRGFDKQLWKVVAVKSGPDACVTLAYTSADGEEGFPGALDITATYTLSAEGELRIDYAATTTKPTVVNITNHSYFNLGGEGSGRSILDHLLTVPATQITPVDSELIPTGEFRSVIGTPFDFQQPMAVGAHIHDTQDEQIRFGHGYDENFVVTNVPTAEPHLMARVEDPVSGRVLELLSNQPGLQVYSGNGLDGSVSGPSGKPYRQNDGLALEPELFPDTPNQVRFGSARLDPRQTYHSIIVYRFPVAAK